MPLVGDLLAHFATDLWSLCLWALFIDAVIIIAAKLIRNQPLINWNIWQAALTGAGLIVFWFN